jgi:lambda family phage portal protein
MISPATDQQWESLPSWMDGGKRRFESANTNRLNSAHWTYAADESVNAWLVSQLSTMRARAIYETKQNGMLKGMLNTHADDIVGPNGPTLQVISEDPDYNAALEALWTEWFKAPTPRPNVSGASLLKLWVRSLWKCGEFLGQIVTDNEADGPIKMRIKPIAPRRLGSPGSLAGDSQTFMGIQFDSFDRPTRYWIASGSASGINWMTEYAPVPADLIIHEFMLEEEDQARGIPWLDTAVQPSADLRDYDDQVQDAARQMADACGFFETDKDDVATWPTPESVTVERRTFKTAPPGWKLASYPATQPPVQYPVYRAERQREFGRPVGMPLMMIRLDASKYNYSSARLETQNYYRAVSGLQYWISGTPQNTGTLSRLVDELVKEARFSIPELRNRPAAVQYQWTWPSRPHVDPTKEANAEATSLTTGTLTFQDALAARGRDIETHIEMMRRARTMFEEAGLPFPAWMSGGATPEPLVDVETEKDDDAESIDEETVDEEVPTDE